MDSARSTRTRRARSRAAFRNDAAIQQAALREVLDVGWDGLSLSRIAKSADLSTRPLYDRFGDLSHIGVDLWESHAGPALAGSVLAVIEAARGDGSTAAKAGDLSVALEPLVRPEAELRAAAELLLAARFDSVLGDAVVGGPWVEVMAACSPSQRGDVTATQSSVLVMAALGYLLAHRRPHAARADVEEDMHDVMVAFGSPSMPISLPRVRTPQMDLFAFVDRDEALASVLTATLHEVGERGYGEATLARIAARSGVSQGFIHSRFRTKVELFIEATRRRHLDAFKENNLFAAGLAQTYGEGIAEAVMTREFCDPIHEAGFSLVLEQLRLAWYDKRMCEVHQAAEREFVEAVAAGLPGRHALRAEDHMHWNISLGLGAHMVSRLLPGVERLPFDVVMVPLVEAQHRA